MSAHIDQMITEFQKFQARVRQAEARFAGVGDMREQIAQVESVATSQDRTVTVTAGAGGTVTGIRLAHGAMRLAPEELSATIMSTLREAVATAVREQARIVDDAFGDAFGINTSERVRQAQSEAFGTPADDPASRPEVTSGRAGSPRAGGDRGEDPDDDFDQNSIYRR